MLTLNTVVSLGKKRKRIGRGGSRGGTSGRGNKGQKARTSGSVGPLFEGGQMPLHRRLPKRGFSNERFSQKFEVINLDRLNVFDAGSIVNREALMEKGLISGKRGYFVKVLGKGTLKKPLKLQVDAYSRSAAEAVKKQGGEVLVVEEK